MTVRIFITGDPRRAIRAIRRTQRAIDRMTKRLRHRRRCPKPLAIDGHAYRRRISNRRGRR